MNRFLAALTLCAAALSAQQVAPPASRADLLVTPEWLHAHLRDANLVILAVGQDSTYRAKHIARAQFVTLRDVAAPHDNVAGAPGLTLEMPSPDTLRARLARLGVSDRSRIIIYQSDDWVSPSTRVALTLEYAGLGARASILDGGLDAWEKAGFPTTGETWTPQPGNLAPIKVHRVVVDADYVRSRIGKPGIKVVDARDAMFYDALDDHGMMHGRRGHVAGALSVPFTTPYDSAYKLLPADAVQQIFTRAGVAPGDTIVGYCHIGQQATAMLFAARSVGHPVLLYDGSYEDWGHRDSTYAVSTQPAKRDP
jgi:thiosulfate/3-mercaptopyruvate sulfurtransferase